MTSKRHSRRGINKKGTSNETSPDSVADVVARQLKARGVERVFALCGGHIMPIWMRLDAHGISIVDVRDERAAVHMAQAHAELTAVRRFIVARVDALVIAPVVVSGWIPVLQEARAAHIPVFIADRSVDADQSLFVARIAADFNLGGRLAGSWLAQASRGRCAIVELQGTAGAAPTIARKQDFGTIISQFSGMRIVRSESGDFTTAGGQRVMEGLIRSTDGLNDVCAVWAHNDNMLLGAIEAMKSAGLHPGRDVLMISVDGVPGIFRAMLAGEANASVELKSDIGKYVFDVVQGFLRGRHDYPKWVVIPSDLHTPEDAAKMLERHASF